jgi:uncharacterized DUF497 family protein
VHDYPFIWDEDKNISNIKKHGVSFNEATSVFDDENAVYFDDAAHSLEEERFIVIGMSEMNKLLMVCHCYRDDDSIIRLISARKANKKESNSYWR